MSGNLQIWTGRILSALVVLVLVADAAVNLFWPELLKATMEAEGFPPERAPILGVMLLVCAALYAYPRTAVLGAILITGFFGGAICVHFRTGGFVSPPQIVCLVIALLAWGGLFLRYPLIRALLPLRT
ncbi:MAG: DoxX family protein [Pseudomonadota bacterium]